MEIKLMKIYSFKKIQNYNILVSYLNHELSIIYFFKKIYFFKLESCAKYERFYGIKTRKNKTSYLK